VTPRDRILVALDTPEPEAALALADRLSGRVGGMKVGLELYGSAGPRIVGELRERGHRVFVDLKLHDIPNTVAGAAAAVVRAGASMFTVHALGGIEMMRRACEAATEAAEGDPPLVLAVTVLTSHDDASLERIGLAGPCRPAVERLVGLAREAGAGGIVCSPLEIEAVRGVHPSARIVVPGIRPRGAALDDQARVATPASAVADGADFLVIGRPITRAADPAAAAEAIAAELEG
jgi:orotidine-5'-phosphate decarboxylase